MDWKSLGMTVFESKSSLYVLFCDARRSNQPVPAGITVYGPYDVKRNMLWPMKDESMGLQKTIYPKLTYWPVTESFFDLFYNYHMTEFSITQTIGPNAFVWGYLAARK